MILEPLTVVFHKPQTPNDIREKVFSKCTRFE